MSTPPANWDARKGDVVRKRRQALDLEQRELAEKVGVHVNSVQRWEKGTQYPGRKLGKLEQVLGFSLSDAPAPPPGISDELRGAIMNHPDLTDDEKQNVLAAVRRQIAIERGAPPAGRPPGS